jgi:proline dehydrogenase
MDSPTPMPAPATTASPLLRDISFEDTGVAFAAQSNARLQKARLLFSVMEKPWLASTSIALTRVLLGARIPGVAPLVRATAFAQFCGGESIEQCQEAVETLGRQGVQSILDYSVEGLQSEAGFDAAAKEVLATIEWAAKHPHIAFSVFKLTGLARFALLEKLNARVALSAEEQAEWERVRARVERLCERAHSLGVRLFIDAEESWIQDVIDTLAEEAMARFNRERPLIYNTYQMYRTASLGNLKAAYARAQAGGYFFGVKLVRGAYMEKERARAKEHGYADPIQPSKEATDADYDRALVFCVENLERMALCAGTHNESSCRLLMSEMARHGVAPDDKRVYFSQLYGMSDNISFNLARAGYAVAKYLPYGPVRKVLPYLIRRAEENSAIAGQGGREIGLVRRELKRRKLEPKS